MSVHNSQRIIAVLDDNEAPIAPPLQLTPHTTQQSICHTKRFKRWNQYRWFTSTSRRPDYNSWKFQSRFNYRTTILLIPTSYAYNNEITTLQWTNIFDKSVIIRVTQWVPSKVRTAQGEVNYTSTRSKESYNFDLVAAASRRSLYQRPIYATANMNALVSRLAVCRKCWTCYIKKW